MDVTVMLLNLNMITTGVKIAVTLNARLHFFYTTAIRGAGVHG